MKANAPSAAQGATVRLFTLADGVRTRVATSTLNELGNRQFKVADANGNRYTKYVARVSATEATQGCWSHALRRSPDPILWNR